MQKKLSTRFNSQQSSIASLFLNIIESKYENGLPSDFFFCRDSTSFLGLYQFRQNTQFSGGLPENLWKLSIYEKCFSTKKLDEKAGILRCERMETIIHFRKNLMAQPSFYHSGMFIKQTPLLQKECPLYRAVHFIEVFLRQFDRKASSLQPICYKIEEIYFKDKIWVLYKLKTKASGKS